MVFNNGTRLTLLLIVLREAGFTDLPGYRRMRDFGINGGFPVKQVNGRYYFAKSDLPLIAATLGLERPEEPRRAA